MNNHVPSPSAGAFPTARPDFFDHVDPKSPKGSLCHVTLERTETLLGVSR